MNYEKAWKELRLGLMAVPKEYKYVPIKDVIASMEILEKKHKSREEKH